MATVNWNEWAIVTIDDAEYLGRLRSPTRIEPAYGYAGPPATTRQAWPLHGLANVSSLEGIWDSCVRLSDLTPSEKDEFLTLVDGVESARERLRSK
jgi:hypothetical protein